MKRKTAEQTAVQAVGTWSEMDMEGIGVHFIKARDSHSASAQRTVLCSPICQGCTKEPKCNPLPTAGHIYTCGHTAHVAEWNADFEGLTMEVCCWMLLITSTLKGSDYPSSMVTRA